jgi:hypothetical protein
MRKVAEVGMSAENAVAGVSGETAGEQEASESGTLSLEGLNSTVPVPPENAGFW